MTHLSLILFLILILSCDRTVGQFNIVKGQTSIQDHALIGYNFSSFWVSKFTECFKACIEKDCRCTSFNIRTISNEDGMYLCELNYETKDVVKHALKKNIGYDYYDIIYVGKERCRLNSCSKDCCQHNVCKNNSSCTSTCDDIRRVSCTCTPGFTGRFCDKPANSCLDYLLSNSSAESGFYTVFMKERKKVLLCQMNPNNMTAQILTEMVVDDTTAPNDWIVIQRRQDGSVNFKRNWNDYKVGFGSLSGEFWLGLDVIHRLTAAGYTTLRVDFGDWEGATAFAEYSTFTVGNETSMYVLGVGGYSGTAGNPLTKVSSAYSLNGMKFTTFDKDNDKSGINCAGNRESGFWYNACSYCNPNGIYQQSSTGRGNWRGVIWDSPSGGAFRGAWYSLKRLEMKLRKP